ncbi:MAG: iron-containing alcohol dehydrogenase, partial [Tissierellia bacterium]|nr:iron-containing alcohol dehydrogenase [Tissierellia bacterium]
MMRPMKLAGDQLMFGIGTLEHLKTLNGKKACIVTGGSSMKRSGMLDKVRAYLEEGGIQVVVFEGVEPDPSFSTVQKGANWMMEEQPDWIIALGGGSAMDAAKAMWIYYEHPDLQSLDAIMPPNAFPTLRSKARLCCIPSTAGTASEVSRSIVISDDQTGKKYGLGNMEMMPDVAICDPEVTLSMPARITAETGMDALTHDLEALVSQRANYLSDILALGSTETLVEYLPKVMSVPQNLEYREQVLNAAMVAGIAFTNVSLGIVHSMAHTIGGHFHVAHGLADAVILPYVIRFNRQSDYAVEKYRLAEERLA